MTIPPIFDRVPTVARKLVLKNAVEKGEMTQEEFDHILASPHYSPNFKRKLVGFPPLPKEKEMTEETIKNDHKPGDFQKTLAETLLEKDVPITSQITGLFEAEQAAFGRGYIKALHVRAGNDRQQKAKAIVAAYISSHLDATDETPVFDIYVVWFTFVLGSWKALVSTSLPDGMYYEVTYNGTKGETYLDAYKKFQNVCIKD